MTRHLGGRLLLSAIAIAAGLGGFLADWSPTHLLNESWPPHARFHNAQTMSAGAFMAVLALFFLWRRAGDHSTNMLAAVLFAGGTYWTMAAAFLFPGVAWTDPEFLQPGQSLDRFPAPQLVMDAVATALVALAAWLLRPLAGAAHEARSPSTSEITP